MLELRQSTLEEQGKVEADDKAGEAAAPVPIS